MFYSNKMFCKELSFKYTIKFYYLSIVLLFVSLMKCLFFRFNVKFLELK